ncbi:MAG TPA: transcription-repair coupling factor [Pirellulaceae bacterium]|nr:transcription-repair coupling factor [Pirellulaceae bacterium]
MTALIADAAATERMRQLYRRLFQWDGCVECVAALERGNPATFDGVWGSSCALVAAALHSRASGPLVVVCPTQNDADELAADLELFTTEPIAQFPAWEIALGEGVVEDEAHGQRLGMLKQLARERVGDLRSATAAGSGDPRRSARLIVTSIQGLLQPVQSQSSLAENSRELRVGQRVDLAGLCRWLIERGFHATSAVELPSEFSHRGGILDLFAPDWREPVRIEFFGDEVESIRKFDVASQRSLERLDAVEVTVLGSGVGVRPSHPQLAHLTTYLAPTTWFLLHEPERIAEEGRNYLQKVDRPGEFHSVAAVLSEVSNFAVATVGSILQGRAGAACQLPIESVERFSGDIGRVRDELDQLGEGHEVYVVAPTEAEIERLHEILATTKLAAAGRLHFPLGTLRQGFRLARDGIVVITGGELFHRGELRRLPRRHLGKAIDSFLDLREGDLVVHLAHGIGRYRGLELIEKQGQAEEHLEIEFDGGTKIYVPAVKIDLVQKYVGGTKTRPALAKIGGKSWLRQKQAAEAAVHDLASEMLEMQAIRASRPGIALTPDSDWQREFDASFPYTETPDQLSAIAAIKSDMQRPRPMDRLLCGDVGFGKTEVAMRAAFKAVDNGYQVAVLVPTTILAEQHFNSFSERLAEFPFDIAKLSRFCTRDEERESLAGLKSGKIDIVIGTHRLASSDLEFKNLGLLVIDEEQRFGVDVKERLKMLRATVDVLTLSATPIPRTLHMSLVGLRDISNLETPPDDRIAVETRVTRWDDEMIRHAVLRELARGGQIYFVHNRVQDIDIVAKRLAMIVPEARIRIGHAQMADDELEQVMVDFVAHRFDLLLATTIIESGLDIPNANTIFIDEAERYGLADLHQLRGRVGRYKHRAYCYLLIDPYKYLTPNASRRLRAIEEFSEMGAGFAIAMRDLEIRGAGNLLGTQQSGHIAAVGYELYCQLLENAVRMLTKAPPRIKLDVDIDLPGDAYLPDGYVGDMRLKIDLYRRMSRISTAGDLADFRGELVDRFGAIPEPALRLLALTELKMDAATWQVSSIFLENQFVVFRYENRQRIEQLARLDGRRLRIVDERSAYLPLAQADRTPPRLLALVKSVLRPGK